MTDADRLIIRALNEFESGLCDCGHHRSQSMDPVHDPHDPSHAATYKAGAPFRCFACTELARAQRAYIAAAGDAEFPGTKWATELVPSAPSRQPH